MLIEKLLSLIFLSTFRSWLKYGKIDDSVLITSRTINIMRLVKYLMKQLIKMRRNGVELGNFIIGNFMHQKLRECKYILIQINMQEKRVGDYLITNQILGKGAFSTVFASHNRKHQKLAVKVIPRQNIKQSQLKYFQREVALLRKCKHQYIVDFVDIQKSKSNFYIFLEYCEGGNLADYIERNQRLPELEALRLFGQLIKGMNSMRSMNIIHRDLKPANIMLKNGNIKIVDFGLARKFYNGELMRTYVGSPLNMAPQILKGQNYTDKVDVYSAGTILYEMLYGVSPYEANCREELVREINKGLRHEKQIQVSQSVLKILKEMLEPSPAKRIELSDLLQFVQNYDKDQQAKRIQQYKKRTRNTILYFGVFGSVIAPFRNLCNLGAEESSPRNLDLRMCQKLIQEISC